VTTAPETPQETPKTGRTGRNLPVAIGVGVGLGGLAVLTLLTVKATFLLYMGIALAFALTELTSALTSTSPPSRSRPAAPRSSPAPTGRGRDTHWPPPD
jgi:hypothetical protein